MEIVGDDFPVFHAGILPVFRSTEQRQSKCKSARARIELESFLIAGRQMIRAVCDRQILHTFMFDTIKGIIGDIAAGEIKDQRIALSQEQLTALDAKLRDALSENARLSQRVMELEKLVADRDAKIGSLQPSPYLDPFAFDILKFFFDQSRDLSADDAAAQFSLPIGVAQFHTDSLLERRFIQQTIIGVSTEFGEQPAMFAITSAGRKYVMQHR
jgi:hypothetical protein